MPKFIIVEENEGTFREANVKIFKPKVVKK